jgi:flagellar motor protein MotB
MSDDKQKNAIQNLWLVSYADFMTIMMIFFLCMYGYSTLARAAAARLAKLPLSDDEFSLMVEDLKKNLGMAVEIKDSVNKITVQLQNEILFKSGQATLPGVSNTLDILADSLKNNEGMVVVAGHTDNVPIHSGHFKSNWELSAARAFSVIEALTARGVPEHRLSAWGFGENRPVISNDSEVGRSKNRRIEIVILKGEPRGQ